MGGGSLRLNGNQLINTPSYLLFQKPIENIFLANGPLSTIRDKYLFIYLSEMCKKGGPVQL